VVSQASTALSAAFVRSNSAGDTGGPSGIPPAAPLADRGSRCGVVTLAAQERINPQVIVYLNRLSDLLFVLARVCNRDGQEDVMWVPGGNPLAG